jgi:dipeptidyl aminopeptidase/acylaminoacyl peptidase
MGTLRVSVSLVVCALGVCQAAPPPPAEAYGRLPAIDSAALSPDGKRLALGLGFEYQADKPESDLTALRIVNIDSGKVEHTLAPPASNTMSDVGWADDQRPYYILRESRDMAEMYSAPWLRMNRNPRHEYARTYVFSLANGATVPLMKSSAFSRYVSITNLRVPVAEDPGYGRMVTGISTLSAWRLAVFRVNLDTGQAKLHDSGNEHTASFMFDERGDVIARVDIDEHRDRWKLFVRDAGKERLLLEQVSEMGMPLRLYGLLPDGRIAAVDPHENGARDTLLAIDWKTGAQTPLHKTEGSDASPIGDPWTHEILGVRWTADLPSQHFFDEQLQQIYTRVQTLFADGFATLVSWSRDRSRFLVFGEHGDDAGAYYIYDREPDKLRSIGKTYPSLDGPAALGIRQAIKFRARDGKSVPAYLTLPAGVEPKDLPLVLLVHGGPHARDSFTFDWWASFLASRGYAVLQVNFRGSTGYGYEWFDAGRGGWGTGVMQTDVEDGADALVKNGMVDAARVCIVGASYGGYAALAGATLTPTRYACAVSVNGLTDPEKLFIDANWDQRSMIAKWWRRSMGDDVKRVRAISPSENVEPVRVPILLIHGDQDSVVPVESSRGYNDKLLRAGKDVRYVELKGDDHWLSSAPTRTLMLREIESFLARNLARKTTTAAK